MENKRHDENWGDYQRAYRSGAVSKQELYDLRGKIEDARDIVTKRTAIGLGYDLESIGSREARRARI
jgi:hypothetical protein